MAASRASHRNQHIDFLRHTLPLGLLAALDFLFDQLSLGSDFGRALMAAMEASTGMVLAEEDFLRFIDGFFDRNLHRLP